MSDQARVSTIFIHLRDDVTPARLEVNKDASLSLFLEIVGVIGIFGKRDQMEGIRDALVAGLATPVGLTQDEAERLEHAEDNVRDTHDAEFTDSEVDAIQRAMVREWSARESAERGISDGE